MMFYHPTSFENTGLNSFLVERPCIVLTFPTMAICKGVSSFVTDCPCSLQWRHNGRDSVSNHQPHDCLLHRLADADQRKHQSSATLAFVRGIHRGPVNSPHKWPITRKMFPFDDVIMRVWDREFTTCPMYVWFYTIKSLTKPLQREQYPDFDSLKDLADAFGDFFVMKIQKIRTKLDSQDPEPITIPREPVKEEDMFLSFQSLTEDDVRKLIKQSPNKQCSSDPGMPRFSASRTNTFSKQIPSNWILPWRVEKCSSQTSLEKARSWTCFPKFQTSE